MQRFAITPLAALGILAGTVPAARAADTTCTTLISSGTTINGNLVVPAGNNTCTLANVTVTGNVQVGEGASLHVRPDTGGDGNNWRQRSSCSVQFCCSSSRGDFRRRQCSDSELYG